MIATWCVRAALPLLFCLGDGALARRGERGPALPAGEAAVPALGPAELQWCIAREARIDQEQQAVETAAAALREQAAQVLQARQETLAMEMRGRADRDHGIRSMRPSLGEMLRRDLREREELSRAGYGPRPGTGHRPGRRHRRI